MAMAAVEHIWHHFNGALMSLMDWIALGLPHSGWITKWILVSLVILNLEFWMMGFRLISSMGPSMREPV